METLSEKWQKQEEWNIHDSKYLNNKGCENSIQSNETEKSPE